MGGSGGRSYRWPSKEELRQATEAAVQVASSTAFGAELAGRLGEILAGFNNRDSALVTKRLEDIKAELEAAIEGSIDTLYGGSVAKHTYVDGLSDIDTLLILNDTRLRGAQPSRALATLTALLQQKLGDTAKVESGSMAITLTYPDGMVIQCLPALRTRDGLKVSSSRGHDEWSSINPETFQAALTRRNQECGNKLVPTIKLAKAINATVPKDLRLSGYHIESLAIAAFRGYAGEKTPARMLPEFFEKATSLVMAPIKDSSGQSIHVDQYLGPAKSPKRLHISQLLSRVYRRMRNATASESLHEWESFFE